MELQEINGKVCYVKKDGTPAATLAGEKEVLRFYGFPVLGSSVHVLKGDPRTGKLLLVYMVLSRKRRGRFLLRKHSDECVAVPEAELPYAEQLAERPPEGDVSLAALLEAHADARRGEVDIEALAKERGLQVYPARDFNGYWCKDCGELKELPEGWGFLAKGDAALTRAVRKGEHWVSVRKAKVAGRYVTEQLGTFAPLDVVERERRRLGGKAGRAKRDASKQKAVEVRQENLDKRLEQAILKAFPGIPGKDLRAAMRHAANSGAVGRAFFMFGASYGEQGEAAFGQAAYLAVRAHVRHSHTDYDALMAALPGGAGAMQSEKHAIRQQVAPAIERVLDIWRQPAEKSDISRTPEGKK